MAEECQIKVSLRLVVSLNCLIFLKIINHCRFKTFVFEDFGNTLILSLIKEQTRSDQVITEELFFNNQVCDFFVKMFQSVLNLNLGQIRAIESV